MLTRNHHIQLTEKILTQGSALAPDRFPKADPVVLDAWTNALAATYNTLPVQIWPEAVDVWVMELAGDRMATPRDIRQAAHVARDRWEAHPMKRQVLRLERERRQQQRDHAIEEGTFCALTWGTTPEKVVMESNRLDREPAQPQRAIQEARQEASKPFGRHGAIRGLIEAANGDTARREAHKNNPMM